MNVAIIHPELARRLRIFLMAEHLGLCDEDELFQLIDTLGQVHLSKSDGETTSYMDTLKRQFRRWRHPDSLKSARRLTGDVRTRWQEIEAQVADPYRGLALLAKQAKENLQAIKTGQPLVGHVLPYVPHTRAQDYGIEVNAANGWLDALSNPQTENASMALN